MKKRVPIIIHVGIRLWISVAEVEEKAVSADE